MAGTGSNKRQRKRRTARLIIISTLVFAVVLFFFGLGKDDFLEDTKANSESIVSPVVSALSMPVRGFENAVEGVRNRTRAHRENARLKQELAQLRDVEARANAMAIKLSRFESILNVDGTSGIPEQKIAARAVSEKDGPFVRSVLINAGAAKGIKPGHAVMTEDGFLGHVIRVGNRSARVLHAEDLNSRIAVMSERSQSRAIMSGQNNANPVLSFVADDDGWRAGDRVITSGDEGVLPFGLPIGEVKEDRSGRLVVELFANRKKIDWIWVYPFEPILAPELDPVTLENDDERAEVDAPDEAG